MMYGAFSDRSAVPAPRRRRLLPRLTLALLAAAAVTMAFQVGRVLALQQPDGGQPVGAAPGAPDALPLADSLNTDETPADAETLLEIERRVREAVVKAVPATVGLRIGPNQGSGVIVSPEGLILTAAHVSGRPGQACVVILPDGRTLRGRTLGRVQDIDASMIVVDDDRAMADGPLPYAEVGPSGDLGPGTWTVATGHPGGYEAGRPPVVRVGRINANRPDYLQSDNTLVGGDSGGPLFDLDGRVIGIHSRIGDSTASNVHVPSDRYLEAWDAMLAGEETGGRGLPSWMNRVEGDDGIRLDLGPAPDQGRAGRPGTPYGLDPEGERDPGGAGQAAAADDGRPGATVASVLPDSPAEAAGVRPGDRILSVDDRPVGTEAEMMLLRARLKPGEPTAYRIARGGRELDLTLAPVEADSLEEQWDGWPGGRGGPGAAYRGVMGITPELDRQGPGGVFVRGVYPDGPADRAGVRAGETVVAIAGARISDGFDLQRQLARLRGGDVVAVRLRRQDGRERTVRLTLANRADLYLND